MIGKVILSTVVMATNGIAPVSIHLSKQVVMHGGSIDVVCTVPPRNANRTVAAVVNNYHASERQLDGEKAPKTWRFTFDRLPCDADSAACVVHSWDRGDDVAAQPLTIAGCN